MAHKCIHKANKGLAEQNTRLALNPYNSNTIFVETEQIEKKRGSGIVRVAATFCPFCGERLREAV